jgi:acyl-CoA synthetase (AMP-forming)/AMP-acid ligase II
LRRSGRFIVIVDRHSARSTRTFAVGSLTAPAYELEGRSMRVPLTIADFLDRATGVYPDRVAVVDEPSPPGGGLGSLTWRQVGERAAAQAAALDELGLGRGERVAIVSHNAARLLVSFFGVSGYGRVLVPVNFRLGRDEVRYIVEHSGATVLLYDPEVEETVAGIDCKHRLRLGADTDDQLYRFGAEPEAWTDLDEDGTATINYTSGTTSRPKGVQMTHRNIWVNAAVFGWHAGVSERDVYLHTLPMFHCNGWGMPFALAAMGVPQVVLRKVDGADILRRIDEHDVTLLCGAPAVVAAILDAAKAWDGPVPGRDRMRIVVAGAPPPTRAVERVETELGWEFIQIYGLTETSPLLTMTRRRSEWDDLDPGERARKLNRAGAPTLGVRIDVDGEGEVLARSNVVLAGYWDQPEATEAAIVDGWFHTGDGGAVDDEGYLHIVDRKKDVIITGGENVSSIEVEDCLMTNPAVAEAAVIAVPHEKWGETPKALVVLAEGEQATEDDLMTWCRDRLAHFKCPTSVEVRDQLPRTATGKLQKFKLRAPYWEGHDRQVN